MTELIHYGIPRHSGRFPWGSGDSPHQSSKEFLDYVDYLHNNGMHDTEIAKGLGMDSVTQLRAYKSIAKNEQHAADAALALRLQKSGMSTTAIGVQMKRNESSVRQLLNPAIQERNAILGSVMSMLRDQVAEKGSIDVGLGNEQYVGVSQTFLNIATIGLKNEGYRVDQIKVPQVTTGKFTTMLVLSPPGTTYAELIKNQYNIGTISNYSEDRGRTFLGIEPPVDVNSKRIGVRYAEDGGGDREGLIQLRRGVDDISLGDARYAQVRIAVDGTHFLKGMAMYADDLPDGVDLMFNTKKNRTANKLDAMKKKEEDEDNPFGSVIRQRHYVDNEGKTQLSPLNIVGTEDPLGQKFPGEEGGWYNWAHDFSSQMLSKQAPALAKDQLALSYASKQAEFDEILSLTNPAVRRKLLQTFADSADSSSVHLEAASLPRTRNHVILPIKSLKDTEIYAPNYRPGEKVVLIRHPHGGKFEIPELTVNNRNREAVSLLKNAADAVGINAKVAHILSGADFDGDTVLVIPNPQSGPRRIVNSSPLAELKDFDPQIEYPGYDGMKPMVSKQQQMGSISNLITDMTIKGANLSEIARAVRHAMVVIDAEKHNLNYKQSAIDNGINELKTKYQGKSNAGAATLISKAGRKVYPGERRPRHAAEGGSVDPVTGEKKWQYSGATYTKYRTRIDPATGKKIPIEGTGKKTLITTRSKQMLEIADARTLSSGQLIEEVYADHANRLKAMANTARKAILETKSIPYSQSANKAYANEVASLSAKLNVALMNSPLERHAQLLANAQLSAKRQAKPDLEPSEIKKIGGMALVEMRVRVGAKKQRIAITQSEWDAIQAGAITNNKLTMILDNAPLDLIKKLATPRADLVISTSMMARARSMLATGATQSEVADALGVAIGTLNEALIRKES